MASKLIFFILVIVTYECSGGLITGLLDGAHDAAGAFLGGISHGFNLNIKGQAGFNSEAQGPQQHHHGGHRPGRPEETIVVVVEDKPDRHDHGTGGHHHGPPNHNERPHGGNDYHYKPHHRPGYDYNPDGGHYNQYDNKPNGHPHSNSNSYPGQDGNWNVNPAPNGHRNEYNPHGNPNTNSEGNPNHNAYPYQGDYPNQGIYPNEGGHWTGNNPQGYPENNNNGYHQTSYKPNQSRPYPEHTTEQIFNKPDKHTSHNVATYKPTETSSGKPNIDDHKTGAQNINKHEKTTQNPSDEYDLFVPLKPNDYVYGGDKIDVNTPKTDTGNGTPDSEDEDLPIDIRISD